MRQRLIALLLLWSFCATVLALWPFDFNGQCVLCQNQARVDDSGALVFAGNGLAQFVLPDRALDELIEQAGFQIDLEVVPADVMQGGPARIFSYSADPYRRNITIAQEGVDLMLRLRTGRRDRNGLAGAMFVPDVFAVGQSVAISVTHSEQSTAIAINGVEQSRLAAPVDFSAWTPRFGLYLGNEGTGNRPWRGQITQARFQAGPEAPTLVAFSADRPEVSSQVSLPARFWGVNFVAMLWNDNPHWSDAVLHLGMFVPFGFLCGLLFLQERVTFGRVCALMLLVTGFALAIEFVQEFLASRSAAWFDQLYGMLGGAIGLAAAWAWRRRRSASASQSG